MVDSELDSCQICAAPETPHLQVVIIASSGRQRDVQVAAVQLRGEALRRAVYREGEHRGLVGKDGRRPVALHNAGARHLLSIQWADVRLLALACHTGQ